MSNKYTLLKFVFKSQLMCTFICSRVNGLMCNHFPCCKLWHVPTRSLRKFPKVLQHFCYSGMLHCHHKYLHCQQYPVFHSCRLQQKKCREIHTTQIGLYHLNRIFLCLYLARARFSTLVIDYFRLVIDKKAKIISTCMNKR